METPIQPVHCPEIDVYVKCRDMSAAATTPSTYTISELSREFEVTARAIRFYEDHGLLAPAREGPGGRHRVYTQRDRTRLKLTLRGKRLGLTLSEIKALVDMYDGPGDTVPQLRRFLDVLQAHREKLQQQREDIEATLAEINTHEQQCRSLLSDLLTGAAGSGGKRAA
jgi:DNA-binding transcriptional MerR regulator